MPLDPQTSLSPTQSYLDRVTSAAVFDLNGLPTCYFTTAENSSLIWTQTIFQILGIQSLLTPLLPPEEFHQVTLNSQQYCAIVLKQRSHYLALALKPDDEILDTFIHWAQQLQPDTFHQDPRFRAR
jgi:hypothetical protein